MKNLILIFISGVLLYVLFGKGKSVKELATQAKDSIGPLVNEPVAGKVKPLEVVQPAMETTTVNQYYTGQDTIANSPFIDNPIMIAQVPMIKNLDGTSNYNYTPETQHPAFSVAKRVDQNNSVQMSGGKKVLNYSRETRNHGAFAINVK
jgi:hypothetical protein